MRGLLGLAGRGGTVHQAGRLIGKADFRCIDVGAFECFEHRDLGHRDIGEEAQEFADIGILGIAPELPILIGTQLVGIEPDRPFGGLAHFGAR